MKKIYSTPAIQVLCISAATIIASSLSSVSVNGEEIINVDNTTNGDASQALVKGYSVWDDDWSNL